MRIGRIAFTAEASNLLIGRYSCNPKNRSGLFHQELGITQRFLTRVQFIYSVDRAQDHYSITEAGLVAERKERKEVVRRVYTLVQKKDKHFLHNS